MSYYLWFLVQFSKSACNNLERSEIIWKVREKIQKPMGNGFIDSSASYFASEHKKYTTSLMVYIGLGFKTRQRRQTVRKQWFCLLLRPLNSNPKPSVSKFSKPSEFFFEMVDEMVFDWSYQLMILQWTNSRFEVFGWV